jgi:hypothetical protein
MGMAQRMGWTYHENSGAVRYQVSGISKQESEEFGLQLARSG